MLKIKSTEYITLNGKKQFISIQADKDNLPLLLYLHGGPGDAALPLANKYNNKLSSFFTFVIWEQRGAGKSYYDFKDEDITIDIFVKDAVSLIKILLKRYKQDKIYLVGHSWGSILGIKLIESHPELIHTYIGCGQVVNTKKSSRVAYEYVFQKAINTGNKKLLTRLKDIDYSYTSENWMNDLLFVTRQVVKYKGSSYGKKNYNSMVKDFILSPDYSIKDLINHRKGSFQSIKHLWPEIMTIDFENLTQFQVPLIFIEGRDDYHVSSVLVEEYYNTIETPGQFHWFEKSGHFPQWSEAEKFIQIMKNLVINCL